MDKFIYIIALILGILAGLRLVRNRYDLGRFKEPDLDDFSSSRGGSNTDGGDGGPDRTMSGTSDIQDKMKPILKVVIPIVVLAVVSLGIVMATAASGGGEDAVFTGICISIVITFFIISSVVGFLRSKSKEKVSKDTYTLSTSLEASDGDRSDDDKDAGKDAGAGPKDAGKGKKDESGPGTDEDPGPDTGRFHFKGLPMNIRLLLVMIVVALGLTALMDFTWAYYISSYPWVLGWLVAALVVGYIISTDVRALRHIGVRGVGTGALAIFGTFAIPLVLTFAHAYAAIVVLVALFIYTGRECYHNRSRLLMAFKGYGALFCISLLIIGGFNPMVHPEGVENPMYESLESNMTRDPQHKNITDLDEIRVISWELATKYLERAYGDSASVLDTDPYVLAENTDPSYVNGKFVWVNAPQYESWKWLGDKDVPFFVFVENDPDKMAEENPDIMNRIQTPLNVHKEKIEWKDRIWNLAFDKFAGQYEVTQIRIDLDDDNTPYWVVYLSERGVIYNLPTLKKIMIVSVEDLEDYEIYDVSDPDDVPNWLEVIFPDKYVYEWLDYWGSYRKGLVYSWFNKKHLYDPDDVSPRFLIIQNETYWQMPMRQKDSQVLGGFVQINTRTGEAVFWNREDKSYVSMLTVETQVHSYLSSGEVGFQQLDIHEGYLYPIEMNDGTVREAYIFPLYAGFTVQKYAMVDAEYYTAAPFIDTSLNKVMERFKARGGSGGTGANLTWATHRISNAYADSSVVVVTLENESTHTVHEDDLRGGLIIDQENEWHELKLAASEHARTGNVTIDVVIDRNKIVDVDYLEADLVTKD